MKRFFLLCLTALFAITTWAGSSDKYDFSVDGIYYYILSDGSVAVIDSAYQHATSTYTGDLVIPASVEYDGTPYTVSSIFEYAFYKCEITSITVPETVTSFGKSAFAHCEELKELTIPDGFTTIETSLCSGCKALTSITLPETITSIGEDAFYGCSSLEKITIPEDVYEIKDETFQGCTKLSEVTIGRNIEYIGCDAFSVCTSLARFYSLNSEPPECDDVFYNTPIAYCTLYVPIGAVNAYTEADTWQDFGSIVEIDETITPPTVETLSVTNITNSTATLHGTVSAGSEEILEKGFQYWTNVNALQTIMATSVSDDEISSTIQRLSSATEYTYRAYALTESGYTYGENETFTTTNYDFIVDGIYYYKLSNSTVAVQALYYASTENSIAYKGEVNIPSTVTYDGTTYRVTTINDYAFYECRNLTKVTIPESVTAIGPYSFQNCTSLEEAMLPNTISAIWEYSFYGCASLKEIVIPSSVTSIRQRAFVGCDSITELTVPGTVKTFETAVFANCANLKKVTVEEGVTNTGYTDMFAGCTGLEEVSLPSTMTEMGSYTFGGCTSLKNFVYPNSMMDTGFATFYECTALENVTFSRNITEISNGTFGYCTFEKMAVPEGVTTIGYQAFMRNPNLIEVRLPKTLETMDWWTFYNCTSLSSIYSLNPTPPECLDFANVGGWFDGRKDDCILYVPTGSRDKYASATGWKDFGSIVEIDVLSAETTEATDITKNSATLNGSVSKGTFDVTDKGFEYWTDPLVSTFIAVDKDDLSLTLSDLESSTTYYYRAYATDTTGTTYGETLSFTTDVPEGISSVNSNDFDMEGYYSVSGLKLNAPQKGVNIVLYEDGSTKKVIMK